MSVSTTLSISHLPTWTQSNLSFNSNTRYSRLCYPQFRGELIILISEEKHHNFSQNISFTKIKILQATNWTCLDWTWFSGSINLKNEIQIKSKTLNIITMKLFLDISPGVCQYTIKKHIILPIPITWWHIEICYTTLLFTTTTYI